MSAIVERSEHAETIERWRAADTAMRQQVVDGAHVDNVLRPNRPDVWDHPRLKDFLKIAILNLPKPGKRNRSSAAVPMPTKKKMKTEVASPDAANPKVATTTAEATTPDVATTGTNLEVAEALETPTGGATAAAEMLDTDEARSALARVVREEDVDEALSAAAVEETATLMQEDVVVEILQEEAVSEVPQAEEAPSATDDKTEAAANAPAAKPRRRSSRREDDTPQEAPAARSKKTGGNEKAPDAKLAKAPREARSRARQDKKEEAKPKASGDSSPPGSQGEDTSRADDNKKEKPVRSKKTDSKHDKKSEDKTRVTRSRANEDPAAPAGKTPSKGCIADHVERGSNCKPPGMPEAEKNPHAAEEKPDKKPATAPRKTTPAQTTVHSEPPRSESYARAFAGEHALWSLRLQQLDWRIVGHGREGFANKLMGAPLHLANDESDALRAMGRAVVQTWYLDRYLAEDCEIAQCVCAPPAADDHMQEKVMSAAFLLALGQRVARVCPHASVVRANVFYARDALSEYVFGATADRIGHWEDSCGTADLFAPPREYEGLQRHPRAWRTPVAKEVLAWMRYDENAWPRKPSTVQQPFWWVNADDAQRPKRLADFWRQQSASSLRLALEDDECCELHLAPPARWFDELTAERENIDDALKLVLVRCWVAEVGDDEHGTVYVDTMHCLPVALVHCVRAPWFTCDGDAVVAQQRLLHMHKVAAVAGAVVDTFVHGTYAACVHAKKERAPCPVRALLTCDTHGDAYAHCLMQYILGQKSGCANLQFVSCHRLPAYRPRFRHLSFLVFNLSGEHGADPLTTYGHLFGGHAMPPLPRDASERVDGTPSTLAHLLTVPVANGHDALVRTNVYQSALALDVIFHAIKNRFGHPPRTALHGPNDATLLVVSSESEVPRPTRKSRADLLAKERDLQLEAVLRVRLHDALDDVWAPEFHAASK